MQMVDEVIDHKMIEEREDRVRGEGAQDQSDIKINNLVLILRKLITW